MNCWQSKRVARAQSTSTCLAAASSGTLCGQSLRELSLAELLFPQGCSVLVTVQSCFALEAARLTASWDVVCGSMLTGLWLLVYRAKESERMQKVLKHPDFQANPILAVTKHLQATLPAQPVPKSMGKQKHGSQKNRRMAA